MQKLLLPIIAALLTLELPLFAMATPKNFVVVFKNQPSAETLAVIKSIGGQAERLSPYRSEYFDRTFTLSAEPSEAAAIGNMPEVKSIEAVFEVDIQSVVSQQTPVHNKAGEPLFFEQWYLQNKGFPVRYDINDIKSQLRPGVPGEDLGWVDVSERLRQKLKREVSVAIIDTGVDYEHTEIKHAILLNPAECDKNGDIPLGDAKEDNDKNGYPGDCKGINLTTKAANKVNRPLDDHGHGTHLAGLIAAQSDNNWGIAGISDQIKILPIKTYSGSEKRVAISDRVAKAILYAISRKVDVINLSLGYPIAYDADYIRKAVAEAHEKGVIIVAAAGNNAHDIPVFPCGYESVICVGATQNDGQLAVFSNFGAHVDIMAPGDFILSTYPSTQVPSYSLRGFEVLSGTSQASPLVAGIVALTKGFFPNESVADIRQRILGSRDKDKKINLNRILSEGRNGFENLRLVFKDTSVIELANDGTFQLAVPFENLSDQDLTLELEARPETTDQQILNPKIRAQIPAKSTVKIEMRGRLVNPQASLKANVVLTWKGQSRTQNETIGFFLAKPIDREASVSRLAIENSKGLKFVASAGTLDQNFAGDLFLTFERVDKVDGLSIKIWKRNQDRIAQTAQRQLSRMSAILGYFQADVNGDQKQDLLLLGQMKDGEDVKLIVYYLTDTLAPLYTEDGGLVLDEDPTFDYRKLANATDTKWHLRRDASLGQILMPYIIEKGYVPEVDTSLAERRLRKKNKNLGSFLPRIFFLEPIIKNAKMVLRSRIVDTEEFKNGLRAQLGQRFYEDIEPRFALPNGDFVYGSGQLNRLRSVRLRFNPKNGYFDVNPFAWKEAYSGYRVVRFAGDHGAPDRMGLMGLMSKSRAHIVVFSDVEMSKEILSLIVDIPDESEYIIRPLLLAHSAEGYRVVMETGQNLFGFGFDINGKQLSVHQNRLARSTFYNDLLTQVTWPVLLQDQNQIYVDDTQINARFVWLKLFDVQKGFSSRADQSFTLPINCRTLNPARWEGESFTRLQALCQSDAGMELLSLPLSEEAN